jgi:hypothetical protein
MKLTRKLFAGICFVVAMALYAVLLVPDTHAVTYNPSTYANPPGVYKHVAAGLATTTVKSGAGVLYGIIINTKGASVNTLTCYDNTAGSGTVIALLDTTGATASLKYDIAFGTGLTCVSATGTGADYTVSYR